MTTPDPRREKAMAQNTDKIICKEPTALEALRAYIKEWSKIDPTLKQYLSSRS